MNKVAFKDPYCQRAIEQKFGIFLPAGMGNLSWATREQIKSDHKRRIERIREKMKKGEEITQEDLKR